MRKVTLFTGQWADLPLDSWRARPGGATTASSSPAGAIISTSSSALADDGYCASGATCSSATGSAAGRISNHLVGQAVCDLIDERHQADPAARRLGRRQARGRPPARGRGDRRTRPAPPPARRRGRQRLHRLARSGTCSTRSRRRLRRDRRRLQATSPSAGTRSSTSSTSAASGSRSRSIRPRSPSTSTTPSGPSRRIDRRPEFGFNFDPSHSLWQGVDPVAFLATSPTASTTSTSRTRALRLNGRRGILGSHLNFGDPRRGWDFRSPGRGHVDFEAIIRALNRIGYQGPLSVEWEDPGMDREWGARDALAFTRRADFPPSAVAFDSAFASATTRPGG